ncbi:conjugal transfer protein TrbL family protein [Breznakia pachnodae]|uniref:TrbL/VirB6 plasmid conjugal transfer protein n=1 Tax=Breznakia pachnodae TaxID=265178 RepID=A0ABU0E4B1_9FIRM|nr:conjugal transfer protein TrbL family protein [Breznakia pachnodae]MDQ0361564.1 hypothetical protein [Breznakia pachnodae]
MDLLFLDFFGIGKTVENFFRGIFWGAIRVLMSFITGILEALTKGIMGFPILSNTYIKEAFNASLAIMFLILAPKIIYEIVSSFIKDDEAGLDYRKKIGGAIFGVIIASSLTVLITMVNTLSVNINTTLTSGAAISSTTQEEIRDYCSSQSKYIFFNKEDYEAKCYQREFDARTNGMLGDELLSSVFVGFGGMQKSGDHGSDKLIETYQESSFDIYERDDGDYIWDFSELMVLVGMIIYVILLFMICIQVATRIMAIGFYYVIGPLCCLSLTNYQNPQAFTVWKNSLIGQFLLNITQIFLLGFFSNIVGDIANISETTGVVGGTAVIAQLCLYFAGFSVILTMPNFVQSMIGGYGAGVMDTMNQIRGGLSMGKAMTAGVVTAGVAKTVGRRNSYTGHREGGIRGAVAGNKRQDGTRSGGIVGNTVGQKNNDGFRQGGVRGAIFGDKSATRDGGTRQRGGITGVLRGEKTTTPSTGQQGQTGSGFSSQEADDSRSFKGGVNTMASHAGASGASEGASGGTTERYSGGLRAAFKGTTTMSRNASGSVTNKTSTGNRVARSFKSASTRRTGPSSGASSSSVSGPTISNRRDENQSQRSNPFER